MGVFADVMSVQRRPAWETRENSLVRLGAQPAKLPAWARSTGRVSWTHGFPKSNLCNLGPVTKPLWASVLSSVKWQRADLEETRDCKLPSLRTKLSPWASFN